MAKITVTSRDNSLLRLARATRDGQETQLIFIEGLRLCEEALRSGLQLTAIIYSDEIAAKERAAAFLEAAADAVERKAEVSEKLLATISYTKTPQGIVALARRPESGKKLLDKAGGVPLLVILHGINNPVNVGAILRSAEAAGVTGVVATAHTSDPFSPKSLRGAMGSAFRLPIWCGPTFDEVIAWCKQKQIRTISADLEGTVDYGDVDWSMASALVLGREATGLSAAEIATTDHSVSIPMSGEVESLNVSVAAGILLYEAARQRRAALTHPVR
jgi:TrmH family RNA methyltransferase